MRKVTPSVKALTYLINKLSLCTGTSIYSLSQFSGMSSLTALSLTKWRVSCEAGCPWAELPGTSASSSMPGLWLSLLCLPKAGRSWHTPRVSPSLSSRQHQHRLSRHCHLHSETCQRSLEANLVCVAFSRRITTPISSGTVGSSLRSGAQGTSQSRHSRHTVFQLSQILGDLQKFTSGVSAQTEKLKARTNPHSINTSFCNQ